jgi:hypothetical protein
VWNSYPSLHLKYRCMPPYLIGRPYTVDVRPANGGQKPHCGVFAGGCLFCRSCLHTEPRTCQPSAALIFSDKPRHHKFLQLLPRTVSFFFLRCLKSSLDHSFSHIQHQPAPKTIKGLFSLWPAAIRFTATLCCLGEETSKKISGTGARALISAHNDVQVTRRLRKAATRLESNGPNKAGRSSQSRRLSGVTALSVRYGPAWKPSTFLR